MLHGNMISMKEVCHNRYIAMACDAESEVTNPFLCVIFCCHSHIQTLPLVVPHLQLVQCRPHHLTQIASACALCSASNQFLSNPWFSMLPSLTWSNSITPKASSLMVHIYVGPWAQIWLLPWGCLEAI